MTAPMIDTKISPVWPEQTLRGQILESIEDIETLQKSLYSEFRLMTAQDADRKNTSAKMRQIERLDSILNRHKFLLKNCDAVTKRLNELKFLLKLDKDLDRDEVEP